MNFVERKKNILDANCGNWVQFLEATFLSSSRLKCIGIVQAHEKKKKVKNLTQNPECDLDVLFFLTSAGTEPLEKHLCSSTFMKSGLLVQKSLLLQLLLLKSINPSITRYDSTLFTAS